ncbi:MAG: hypothetical protein SFZ03_00370 [Candidatus Melainabacteria bacterium]|nr:hypothetical protein [Candidatus Melainabacteria bacterium]
MKRTVRTPKTTTSPPKGLWKKLLDALSERYQRILEVFDQALVSDNLKDRIWAVDQILKRLAPEADTSTRGDKKHPAAAANTTSQRQPSTLSEQELMQQIRELLNDESL